MNRFAGLLDRLAYEPGRNAKLRLMTDYFAQTPDPDRGWALAALTGALTFRHAKPGVIRALIAERADPVLFEMSHDYVGDLSETVALMWPATIPALAATLPPVGGEGRPRERSERGRGGGTTLAPRQRFFRLLSRSKRRPPTRLRATARRAPLPAVALAKAGPRHSLRSRGEGNRSAHALVASRERGRKSRERERTVR